MSLKVSGWSNKTKTSNSDTICAFPGYQCTLPCLDGYNYCMRHILQDKTAPFQQCSFTFPDSSKRCFRAGPIIERKESYCHEHLQQVLKKHQKLNLKQKPAETPEYCLTQLSHHYISPLSSIQNAIPDPASAPSVASTALQYKTPDEDDPSLFTDVNVRLLPRLEDDSELDSAESDFDPLEHAGVYTIEEASRIYLEKLNKLKTLYTEEYKRLWHLLKENKRDYFQAARVERETMMSIHAQPKLTAEERQAYQELKALSRYHNHYGKEALLHKRNVEKRLQSTEGAVIKPSISLGCVKCIYSEGSWRCGLKSVPLSKYCFKHILQDERQVLFRACGSVQGGGEACEVPVIPLPHTPMCMYHTTLPPALPVSDPPVQSEPTHFSPSHHKIIDFSDSSAFIISEIPPENVMEGDSVDNSSEKETSTPTRALVAKD